MGEYKFYQDRKVTSWERDYFSVKANSYEEAEAIVRSWNCEDVSNIIDNRLCYEEWQVEKPLNFDPFGHAELSLFAKI